MSRRDNFLVAPMLVLFMSHGLLYYLFPEQHYTAGAGGSGWISYIKYLCLMIALPAIVRGRFHHHSAIWFAMGTSLLIVPVLIHLYWANEGNIILIQFQMASLGYFFLP